MNFCCGFKFCFEFVNLLQKKKAFVLGFPLKFYICAFKSFNDFYPRRIDLNLVDWKCERCCVTGISFFCLDSG